MTSAKTSSISGRSSRQEMRSETPARITAVLPRARALNHVASQHDGLDRTQVADIFAGILGEHQHIRRPSGPDFTPLAPVGKSGREIGGGGGQGAARRQTQTNETLELRVKRNPGHRAPDVGAAARHSLRVLRILSSVVWYVLAAARLHYLA
jgi:hypothetical protein